ncbi:MULTISPECIES: hypothetical protein [Streptomyces]|uniref:hypothetical protein n=1 Tax=Streptomyces TaxID=1883 RepID=UPI002784ABD8|nr:hypothetical protein [Streptomyces canus]MDQ0761513.1 hypothetical protein [Streptomyces canus]
MDTVSTAAVSGRVLGTVLQHQPDGSGPQLGIHLLRHDMHPSNSRRCGIKPAPTWSTLSLDHSVAARSSAVRLGEDFAGIYGPETIERFGLLLGGMLIEWASWRWVM